VEQIVWYEKLRMGDVERVGGKNASLGEMIGNLADMGVKVPGGFATTADAYRGFMRHGKLNERIENLLSSLDVNDVTQLAEDGRMIRQWIMETPFPEVFVNAVTSAWNKMEDRYGEGVAVAVRSSATAEDLPDASFAGQQETFLNVRGLDEVFIAMKKVFASLFTDRAIAYRAHKGYAHKNIALSAGVQKMVRSDIGAAGVMFTLDTESGFRDVVFITSSYGLGESVVQGAVNPDEFYLHKENLKAGRPALLRRTMGSKAMRMVYNDNPDERVRTETVEKSDRQRFSLTLQQLEELGRTALTIEQHYARPMDIEWALDGEDGELYIVQARPETVESRAEVGMGERFKLLDKGKVLATGRSVGQKIGSGPVRVVDSVENMECVQPGDVLVTDMTDPDWEPVMKRASAIVTNRGGRTCHAAIIARELGIPAVVACGDATETLHDGEIVTVSCAEGDDGYIYEGRLEFSVERRGEVELPGLPLKIMMNLANPGRAFSFSRLPNAGVGLARLEFIINETIGVHPRALLEFDKLPQELKEKVEEKICGYESPTEFYVQKIREGIATLAASFHPQPVIVRMSDFKSNEYANLLGGDLYEPNEENPMIGFRGASRYLSDEFGPCFEMECRAVREVRNDMGFDNVEVMIPFVRTLEEAEKVTELLAKNGLKRGENGLRVVMMCELPSNAVLAEQFLQHFDGFSIGSNDMTQLTLGMDRDSGLMVAGFDERNPAVKKMLELAISAAKEQGKYVGICGQGPSDYPELAEWLLEQGVSSISLNPDTVVDTWLHLAGNGQG
jgi:pyruvate, water dikinase